MRTSVDEIEGGVVKNGYDYKKQVWIKEGIYCYCGHPINANCKCYGRQHAGEHAIIEHRA